MRELGRFATRGARAAVASSIAAIALAYPAIAAPTPSPTVSLQQAWTIPAPGPMSGWVAWSRTPGVFFSPDSRLAYSALGQRSYTGRYTCDDLGPGPTSVIQAIDTASGTVVSTFTPDLPARAPITQWAMDDSAQRIVVFSGTCPSYVWTSLDATTGATLARWEMPFSQLPVHLAMGNDPSWVYVLDTLPADRVDFREFRVRAMNTLTGNVRWTSSIGVGPWADFGGDNVDRQYRPERLAVSADGSRLYILKATQAQVMVLDTASGQIIGTVTLPSSTDLRSITVSPVSPRMFVTDWGNNAIRVVDTDTLTVTGQFSVPGRCLESMDIDATGDILAVLAACDSPRTILMRTSDGSVLAEAAAPSDTSEIRMLPNGSGLVARRSAELNGSTIRESLPPARPKPAARPIPAPAEPRAVQVATTTSTARITWRPSANAKQAKVTGYRVTARPGGQTCLVKPAATGCTLAGLQSGRRYAFTVEARNAAGWGLRTLSPVVTMPVPPAATPEPAPAPTPKPSQPIT